MAASRFWALEQDEKLIGAVKRRVEDYYEVCERRGRLDRWERSHQEFYAHDDADGASRATQIRFGGERGELSLVKVNQFRSFVRHINVLVTGSRDSHRSYARSDDYKAKRQAQVFDKVIEHDMARGLESRFERGLEIAQLYSEAFLLQTWDPQKGDITIVDQQPMAGPAGQPLMAPPDEEGGEPQPQMQRLPIREGGPADKVLTPADVIRDPRREDYDHRWFIVRERVNRWDLAAEFPEHAKKILDEPAAERGRTSLKSAFARDFAYGNVQDDETLRWTLYHDRTPALPDGRQAEMCGSVVLTDGPLAYDELPVYPLCPHVEILAALGHIDTWDMLVLQEALDALWSTIMTRLDATGLPVWGNPSGSGLDSEDIRGLRFVNIQGDKMPEVINDLDLPPGLFTLMQHLLEMYMGLSGINEVARGSLEGAKSGTHAALIHSMALQYNSGLQRAFARWKETALTGRLRLYQRYASTPRLIRVAGKRYRGAIAEFSSDDIKEVALVQIETDSPLLRTMGGKRELAKEMLAAPVPLIQTADQYFQVLTEGKLDPLTERPRAQRQLIDHENELLMEAPVTYQPKVDPMTGMPAIDPMTGQPQMVPAEVTKGSPTDDHALHMAEHSCLLDEPTLRLDNDRFALISAHVQWHFDTWFDLSQKNPSFLEALGQQPLAGAMALMAPTVDPETGEPVAPPVGGEAGTGEGPKKPDIPGADPKALPSLPRHPSTGQQYSGEAAE